MIITDKRATLRAGGDFSPDAAAPLKLPTSHISLSDFVRSFAHPRHWSGAYRRSGSRVLALPGEFYTLPSESRSTA